MPNGEKSAWKNLDKLNKYRKRINTKKTKRNDNIIRSFKDAPCEDCGIKYPYYVMEFDHVRGVKKCDISEVGRHLGVGKLIEELCKCDVVCSNCHKIREYTRRTDL